MLADRSSQLGELQTSGLAAIRHHAAEIEVRTQLRPLAFAA